MRQLGIRARVSAIVCAKCPAPKSGEVVAIDRRDDDVRELHRVNRARDIGRLVRIRRLRRAVHDVAVAARARARVAEDHERRGAMMPALADVRAVRFLADRVQAERAASAP